MNITSQKRNREIITKVQDSPRDDNSIIFEYNSYQKKVRYPLKYNLKKGTHSMYVQASDRVGNRSIVKGDFYIK